MKSSLYLLLSIITAVAFSNCAGKKLADDQKPKGDEKPKFVNPYPEGTYENFTAEPSYPKTYKIYKNEELFSQTDGSNSSLELDLKKQRGILKNGDTVVMDYPISSGKSSHPTPYGTFPISEKIIDKKSNRYGKILNSSGDVINGDADSKTDSVPAGGKFVGAPMKYWMRLTGDGIGHHIGKVPRYPASHGCIRGYAPAMPDIFSKVRVGTKVWVH